ncbi:NADP-dependent oxidoreductase [Anaerosporomusa subterranea]|uniref:NADP-dependent oxidoreductase n=1 Tax=Anaerosporomusa subterranea TaxID=1794912 RepID=A0A154BPC1_ANASB|nr:aldo/keto reductase [Anaerosporomusa subterranea]KYZ75782.1 NADP-dependent oxidoreductase [Anaerosporomusa subterranea]
MIYKKLGNLDVEISRLAMGGHEYLPTGASRGFNEDFELAIKPNYIFDGFGQDARKQVLAVAFENGINLFDVTMDSEKEALGRNLKEMRPPYDVFIQTRPEGMGYTYDRNNVKMAQYDLLRAEVQRIVKLLDRDQIEFLNLPFMKTALDNDPDYLVKIKYNIEALKREGLIRFACADTFSGEYTYLKQIEAGCFDVVYINCNFGDYQSINKVLPAAQSKGMGVVCREAYMKGKLFKMAEEIGADKSKVAHAALKWCLSHDEVTTVVYGTGKPRNLIDAISVLNNLELTEEDLSIIEKVKQSALFKEFAAQKDVEFLHDGA